MIRLILRIFRCLDKKRLQKLLHIQIITILIGILNVISAILIAPFIFIISGEKLTIQNSFLQKVLNFFNSFGEDNLLLIISVLFVSFYVLAILFNLILSYFSLRWTQDINIFFQRNLYDFYLKRNWIAHTETSSSQIISKIHTDTQRITSTVVLQFLELVSNTIISSGMFIAIFLVDFKIALISILIFGIFYSFFFYYFKKRLRIAGDTITKIYPIYYKSMFEAFISIKDVILFDKKNFFKKSFSDSVYKLRDTGVTQAFVIQIPRNFIEIIFFISLVMFIFTLTKFYNYKFAEITAIIGFYGICALKTIPALQKIFKAASTINSNLSAFENIEQDLIDANKSFNKTEKINLGNKINFEEKIELKNVSFTYPSNKDAGVYEVNMKIPHGCKVGIVGKTGSGKSTLLDLILGFIKPDKGDVKVDNITINSESVKNWHKNLSYVPQNFYIYEGTIESNIAFAENEDLIDKDKLKNSLIMSELNEFIRNTKADVGENGKKLSGGQKQRAGIARAVYKNSEVMVLDEATSALDTITERKILKNFENSEKIKTLIIVSHRFETLKMCDKFYFVEEGKVEELKNFNELITKYKIK